MLEDINPHIHKFPVGGLFAGLRHRSLASRPGFLGNRDRNRKRVGSMCRYRGRWCLDRRMIMRQIIDVAAHPGNEVIAMPKHAPANIIGMAHKNPADVVAILGQSAQDGQDHGTNADRNLAARS